MDAEEVLKEYLPTFRKRLEVKSLMLEIGHIFTTATQQEIDRKLDREGNLIAMDMILCKLPHRDNWVNVFHKALNGKEIKLPKLAKLFEPFLGEEDDFEISYDSGLSNSLEQRYSLETRLEDIPQMMTKWTSYIHRYGLDPGAKLGDLMDQLYLKDKNAYDRLKTKIGISHSYVRQATSLEETVSADHASRILTSTSDAEVLTPTTTKSLPVMPNRNDYAPSIFQQTGIEPLREAIYYQEKALEKNTQNLADNTVSLPDTVYHQEKALDKTARNVADGTASLPVTVNDQEKALEKSMVNETRNIASVPTTYVRPLHVKKILGVNEGKKGVPEIDKEEFREVDDGKVGFLGVNKSKVGVLEGDEGKSKVEVVNKGLEMHGSSVELPPMDSDSVELPTMYNTSVKLSQMDSKSKAGVLEVDEGKSKVEVVDKELDMDSGSVELPQMNSGSVELPPVDGALECENNASLPTETNQETFSIPLYVGVLVLGILSIGYFWKKR